MRPNGAPSDDGDWNWLSFWLLALGVNKKGSALLRLHTESGKSTLNWIVDPTQLQMVPSGSQREEGWLSLIESDRATEWLQNSGASLGEADSILHDAWCSQEDLIARSVWLMGAKQTGQPSTSSLK